VIERLILPKVLARAAKDFVRVSRCCAFHEFCNFGNRSDGLQQAMNVIGHNDESVLMEQIVSAACLQSRHHTSSNAITLSNNNGINLNGTLIFTGTKNLSFGSGAVIMAGASRTITTNGANLTVGAVSGGFGLTKNGVGTLTVGGNSNYTGTTTVSLASISAASHPTLRVAFALQSSGQATPLVPPRARTPPSPASRSTSRRWSARSA